MRYLAGFIGGETVVRKLVLGMMLAGLATLPQSASAQAVEGGGSRVERWHPEAFVDPTAEPPSISDGKELSLSFWQDEALKLVLFSAPAYSFESGINAKETNLRARRVGIGVGVSVAVVLIVVVAGSVAVGNSISRGFE